MSQVESAYLLLNAGKAEEAVEQLSRSAAAGDAGSLLELGIWFVEGRHVLRDLRRARDYFRQAGERGEVTAEHVYIGFLANGIGGEADWQAAQKRLQILARSDSKARRQVELLDAMALDQRGYPKVRPTGRQLSTEPQVQIFDAFASRAECAYLSETAEPLLRESVIVDPATGQMRAHPVRTSEGAVFPWTSEDMVISALNRRIAVASNTDAECGEPLQVLRYRPGQEYRPHFDALPVGDNQRVLTMLVYLNGGYEGGETLFTETGLKIAGKAGDALLFRNADPAGTPDPKARHAGLPVKKGDKFVASRWIRERPMVAR